MIDLVKFWKEECNADSAEWYPFDDGVVDTAWIGFLENRSDSRAMVAVEAILGAGLSLPKELNPFILKAVGAWSEARGNKQQVSAARTKETWENIVGHVHLLRMEGATRDEAINMVAEMHRKDVKTVTRRYKSSDYEEMKKAVVFGLANELLQPDVIENRKLVAHFMAGYPNFIKDFVSRSS